MQKLINIFSISSFVVSAAIVGSGVYLYANKDVLIEDAREKVTKAATEAIAEALPGLLNSSMPKLPSATGGEIPTIPGVGGVMSSPNIKIP